jgi:hypothetical protein
MKQVIRKMGRLAKEIANERGQFMLFALVLPENAIAWDLVIAADWIEKNNMETIRFFAKKIQDILTKEELREFSAVILLDNDEFGDVSAKMESQTGQEETDIDFFGRHIEKGYIFVAPVEDFQLSR